MIEAIRNKNRQIEQMLEKKQESNDYYLNSYIAYSSDEENDDHLYEGEDGEGGKLLYILYISY